jgi:hypothetical protein
MLYKHVLYREINLKHICYLILNEINLKIFLK